MKLVVLDRDGVINVESAAYIKSPEEWQPMPGSLEAIVRLKQAGFTLALATNQSGIARGLFSEAILHKIHDKMQQQLIALGGHIDLIRYCPHHPNDFCACRKPKPGLLTDIGATLNCPLEQAIFIGDSTRDMQAANAAGCQGILLKTGFGLKSMATLAHHYPDLFSKLSIYDTLSAAATAIIDKKPN